MIYFMNINLFFIHLIFAYLSNHILRGFESEKSTGMILLDLQKAFVTLHHNNFSIKWNILVLHQSYRLVWFLLQKAKHCCRPWENSFRNRNFELQCPSRINIRLYTILLYVHDMKTALKNCFTQMIRVYFIAAKWSSLLK